MWWRDRSPLPTHNVISTSEYKSRLTQWNALRASDTGVDNLQRRGIAELVIRTEDDWDQQEGTLVSLFAVSNTNNISTESGHKVNVLRMRIRQRGNYIINYPDINYGKWWNGQFGINFSGDVVTDGKFSDHASSSSQYPYRTYDTSTAIWWMRRIDDLNYIMGEPFDIGHPLVNLWYIETDKFDHGVDQNLLNNQTHHVKYFTSRLREMLNHDNDTLHAVRRLIIIKEGGIPIINPWVTGYLNGEFVSVAGHIINLLLASHFQVIDVGRWLLTVENNFRNGKVSDLVFEGENQDELWHSKTDWLLGIKVYILMAKTLFGEYNEEIASLVRDKIVEIYGDDLREGRESNNFRISEEGRLFLTNIKE
jgi:hypothetical protein